MNKITRFIWLIAMLLLVSGCRKSKSPVPIVDLNVVFDWTLAPGANPGAMSVYFYGSDGYVRRFDFSGRNGGKVRVPAGNYNVIAYNNDSPELLSVGTESFETHGITTRSCPVLMPVTGGGADSEHATATDEEVLAMPDDIYCAVGRGMAVSPVKNGDAQLKLSPYAVTEAYRIELRNLEGVSTVGAMCGALSGMPAGWMIASQTPMDKCITLPFAMKPVSSTCIGGTVQAFRHKSDCHEHHYLTMYIWMDNGQKYVKGLSGNLIDLSAVMHDGGGLGSSVVTVEGIRIPPPIGGQGGFIPSADDWIDVEKIIEI